MEKLAKEKEVVGIYISGHPLDDYKFEMQYFCPNRLEVLKNIELYVNKNLAFGGIVTNVQHLTAKNGKGWAKFNLEGYDESYEFRIFDEEYLKFRHFLVQNHFVFLRVNIKEGWVNRETGKKSDPRIQFILVQSLQDVLKTFAKKLIIHLNIKDLQAEFITKLNSIFHSNKGDNTVTFEIMELEKIMKQIEIAPQVINPEDISIDEDSEILSQGEEQDVNVPTEVEETRVITRLSMPSRKLKVAISSELLQELEKMQVNFKLN
jgi:DNA polymerase-3 subunit alpha